jgi:hypothetical protein
VTVAHAAVIFGPASCAEAFKILMPLVPGVMADFENGITEFNAVPGVHLLTFFNTAQCCDVELPSQARDAERLWLHRFGPHEQSLTERERYLIAFAAIATDQTELVPSLVGGGALPTTLTSGQTFDFNVQGFIRYLATARRNNAAYHDIAPAWLNFVDRFPHKRAARTLDWPHLVYAARVVATFNPDIPIGTVAQSLHQLVLEKR